MAAFLWFWGVCILHMDLSATAGFKAIDALNALPGLRCFPVKTPEIITEGIQGNG
jgi:hypothetical protein